MFWWILCALGAIALAVFVVVGIIYLIIGIIELLFCS